MEMDLAFLKENAPSIATPIVFTNLSKQTLNIEKYGKVEANEKLICIE